MGRQPEHTRVFAAELGRAFVADLLSEDNRWVNGQCMEVAGDISL